MPSLDNGPEPNATSRVVLVRRGVALSALTAMWNLFEGFVAIVAGTSSSSVALIAFGVDSFVETASALVVGWRFTYEMRGQPLERVERVERFASRTTGGLLLLLALYVLVDSGRRLLGFGTEPRLSVAGMAITAAALLVMPALGWAKLRTSRAASSRALRADAYGSIACAWLSLTTLVGLVLNAALGWWWADPAAGLILVPLIAREGLAGLRCEDEPDEH